MRGNFLGASYCDERLGRNGYPIVVCGECDLGSILNITRHYKLPSSRIPQSNVESDRRDFVATIFPEGKNAIIIGSSVSDGLLASQILQVPHPYSSIMTSSLWPSRDGQILVRGPALKIIFEPVLETSHISTVSSRGTNTRLVWGEWITAGQISPT